MWQINEVVKFDKPLPVLFFPIWRNHMDSYGNPKGVPSLVLEEQLSQWIDKTPGSNPFGIS